MMGTLTFEFNEIKIAKFGITKDEILAYAREYAKKNGMAETSYGVFENDADSLLKIGIATLSRKSVYMDCIKRLILDNHGEKQDLKDGQKKWLAKGGITQMNVTLEQAMKLKNHGIKFKLNFGYGNMAVISFDKQYFYDVQDIIFDSKNE